MKKKLSDSSNKKKYYWSTRRYSIKKQRYSRITDNKLNQSLGIRYQKMDQVCLYSEPF